MTNKILSNVIDPEVLWKIKKTLTPCINAFADYFLNSSDMSILHLKFINLCKKSDLEKEQIRPMAWKIFLKVLPNKENSYLKIWIEKTISDRENFEKIKNNCNKLNDRNNIREIIDKDINRTFQNLKLFKDNYVKQLLSDILFFWSIQPENKNMSYKQGMNDLLSILFFAFFPYYFSIKDNTNNNIKQNNEIYSKEQKEKLISYSKDPTKYTRQLYLFFHDEKYISHDLFFVFSNLMSYGIKDLFEEPNDNTNKSSSDFLNFENEEKEIDIVYKRSLDIFHNMLRNYVLLEEFFQNDKKFQFVDYICIAMHENIKKSIINLKEDEILQTLFRYPQIESPIELIKNAYKIRSFFEFSQYQNQGNNINGNGNNKEIKINLNNNTKSIINDTYNKNKMIHQMTKKEKEKYDFDKKEMDHNMNNINYKKPKKQYINTDFQTNYNNFPNNEEGFILKKMSIVQKLKNIEKKYEKFFQTEDDLDLKFIINEINSKFQLKK